MLKSSNAERGERLDLMCWHEQSYVKDHDASDLWEWQSLSLVHVGVFTKARTMCAETINHSVLL